MNKYYYLLYETGDSTFDFDVALEWIENGFLVRVIDSVERMAVGDLIPVV